MLLSRIFNIPYSFIDSIIELSSKWIRRVLTPFMLWSRHFIGLFLYHLEHAFGKFTGKPVEYFVGNLHFWVEVGNKSEEYFAFRHRCEGCSSDRGDATNAALLSFRDLYSLKYSFNRSSYGHYALMFRIQCINTIAIHQYLSILNKRHREGISIFYNLLRSRNLTQLITCLAKWDPGSE